MLALRRDQARSLAELRSQIAQGKVDYTVGTEFHRQFYNGHGNALGVFFSLTIKSWIEPARDALTAGAQALMTSGGM